MAVAAPDPETIFKFAEEKLNLKGEMSEICKSEVRVIVYNLMSNSGLVFCDEPRHEKTKILHM